MDVGLSIFLQNPGYHAENHEDVPEKGYDLQAYQAELEMACMAESLGFDSLWSVEHHFTGYTMVPETAQLLAYFAARMPRIRLGSMVMVIPWHNPARLAGTISMLDNLSGGRFILGIGRGVGRIEFDGLGVPMGEARERFVEVAEAVLAGLEQGYIEYEGQHYSVPRRVIRPAPVKTFRGRTYASAVSPESLRIMARLGVGLILMPQKPWDTLKSELAEYQEIYAEVNGEAPPPPIVACHVYCDEDEKRANELGELYLSRYYGTALKHYELGGDHFATTKDYEYYTKTAALLKKHGSEKATHWYADLHVRGTPDQVVDKIAWIREYTGCEHFLAQTSYAGIPYDDARRNLMLYSDKVVPRLKAL